MAEKASKTQANYRQGTPGQHCGICTMFEAPHSCSAVAGKIERDMLCDYFKRRSKTSAERAGSRYRRRG